MVLKASAIVLMNSLVLSLLQDTPAKPEIMVENNQPLMLKPGIKTWRDNILTPNNLKPIKVSSGITTLGTNCLSF